MSFPFKQFFLFLALLVLAVAPDLVQAAYFDEREDVQAFIAEVAARDHFDPDELAKALSHGTPLPKVIELIKPSTQPGIRSWKRYRARFMDAPRISGGIKFWQDHREALIKASEQTGVPPEIIVGIIGVETVYGRNTGTFNTLSALATLAFDYPPRASLFRHELEELFLLAREQKQAVESYQGSYAGAIGLPQFLPSSIRTLALDGDGDGIIDLQHSADDAIFSVANYLASYGWQRGGKIAVQAKVIDRNIDLQALVDTGLLPTLDKDLLASYGIEAELSGQDAKELFTLVDLATPGELTQYWLGYQNFYVITRYNHSSFYAMSVTDLANALKFEIAARDEMLDHQTDRIRTTKKAKKHANAKHQRKKL